MEDLLVDSAGPFMCDLFRKEVYTDVTFVSEDGQDSLSAHRAVLAARCQFFANLLFGKHAKDVEGMKMTVKWSCKGFPAFRKVIEFLYRGEVCFDSDSLAQAVLECANQLEIPPLVQNCESYFQSQELTQQNVCSKLQTSLSNKIEILQDRCTGYIRKNTYEVLNSEDFQECSFKTVRTICNLQPLNLGGEADLLHGAMRWWNKLSDDRKKMLTESFLGCFRFLTFQAAQFADALKRYPDLMTANDKLAILLYLCNPPRTSEPCSLPVWLNRNSTKRCHFTPSSRGKTGAA